MRAYLLLVGALAACGTGRGTVHAEWRVGPEEQELTAKGQAGWCGSSGRILLEGLEGDKVVGVHWHYEQLAPATYQLEAPTSRDSTLTGASAAARYVHLDEVRGYRSLSGELTVTAVDSERVSGRVTSVLQRVGDVDTMQLTMTFDRVPLVADTTLCVAPRPAADTTAPTPAPVP